MTSGVVVAPASIALRGGRGCQVRARWARSAGSIA
jgi:hypothetical protein